MRLLRTLTLELLDFLGDQAPPYAILSHTWGNDEVTFRDLITGSGVEMQGYRKIKQCCTQATLDGFEYVWIDTCCIDRTSSADLSEAINSMFRWYQRAQVCYVYMEDLPTSVTEAEKEAQFLKCRWFTRGWTLPELLALPTVEFFDKNWQKIGNKSELSKLITSATGITHLFNYQEASVAQKFSWAARRQTTRIEDQAYCLMGLFDVSLAPRYGEGAKAFMRLQLKIIRNSDDESIFAWGEESRGQQADSYPSHGLFAPAPSVFANSSNMRRATFDSNRGPYIMTNKGLCMEILLVEGLGRFPLGILNCKDGIDDAFIAVPLVQGPNGRYARPKYLSTVRSLQIEQQQPVSEKKVIYIEQLRESPSESLRHVATSGIETRHNLAPAIISQRRVDLPGFSVSNSFGGSPQLLRRVSQPISANIYPMPTRRLTGQTVAKSFNFKRPRGCILIAIFFAMSVAISLSFGMFFTIKKGYGYGMGDAFTLASYIVAVGAFIASGAGAYHYPHCQCWDKSKGSKDSSTELQSFRRAQ